jgi:flagellar motor switch protein FliG
MDYDKLSKSQKIAAFLIVIGSEAAAEVMRHFDNSQLASICKEMAEMQFIDGDLRQQVLEEFSGVVITGLQAVLGGADYAQATLQKAKGDEASQILSGVPRPAKGSEGSEDIRKMEPRQVVSLIKNEQPQTIAFVMSYLDTAKAAEVMLLLPVDVREEVMERLGGMAETSSDIVDKIAKRLNKRIDRRIVKQSMHRNGGVKSAAELMKCLDKETRNNLLARIAERNGPLGAAIRKQVFGFEDLVQLTASDLQRVVREVDSADMAIALKTAKPALLEAMLASVSKRAAESLKDDISMLGNQKAKDVEAAQDRIMAAVVKLEEAGEITIESEEEANAPG